MDDTTELSLPGSKEHYIHDSIFISNTNKSGYTNLLTMALGEINNATSNSR